MFYFFICPNVHSASPLRAGELELQSCVVAASNHALMIRMIQSVHQTVCICVLGLVCEYVHEDGGDTGEGAVAVAVRSHHPRPTTVRPPPLVPHDNNHFSRL